MPSRAPHRQAVTACKAGPPETPRGASRQPGAPIPSSSTALQRALAEGAAVAAAAGNTVTCASALATPPVDSGEAVAVARRGAPGGCAVASDVPLLAVQTVTIHRRAGAVAVAGDGPGRAGRRGSANGLLPNAEPRLRGGEDRFASKGGAGGRSGDRGRAQDRGQGLAAEGSHARRLGESRRRDEGQSTGTDDNPSFLHGTSSRDACWFRVRDDASLHYQGALNLEKRALAMERYREIAGGSVRSPAVPARAGRDRRGPLGP
jgi:hypothetical protein